MSGGAMRHAVDRHVDWIVQAAARVPLLEEEIHEHVAPELLAASGGPAALSSGLGSLGGLTGRPGSSDPAGPGPGRGQHGRRALPAHRPRGRVRADGRAAPDARPGPAELVGGPRRPARRLGTRVAFLAAEIDSAGRLQVVHGVDAEVQRPVGSAFKLYVLGALAHAVHDGRMAWDEQLAIRDEWKSLPSGRPQDRPAGDVLTLAEFADHMISISDNTATDRLIHHLGRAQVQHRLFGHAQPAATTPFLTSRAMFRLRTVQYPALADEYLALSSVRERTAALEVLGTPPVPAVAETWHSPAPSTGSGGSRRRSTSATPSPGSTRRAGPSSTGRSRTTTTV